jgi:hypothetical protein
MTQASYILTIARATKIITRLYGVDYAGIFFRRGLLAAKARSSFLKKRSKKLLIPGHGLSG